MYLRYDAVLTDGMARPLSVQPCASRWCGKTPRTAFNHRLSELQSHLGPQE